MTIGPSLESAERERRAERDAEQQHGKRPDDVKRARDDRVDPAAEVAGERAREDRQEDRQQRGAGADQQRVAPAVEQADRDVAAALVGAEEELAAPGRADRHAVGRHDIGRLAVDRDLLGEVVLVGVGPRDVIGVQRRRERHRHDDDEQRAEHERHLVAPQPPQRELPRRDARDRPAALLALLRDELADVADADLRDGLDRHASSPPAGSAGGRECALQRSRGLDYFRQNNDQSFL